MSSREYHELMCEHHYTRTIMFALFATIMYRNYGLGPAFACSVIATISNLICMIWSMRRANGRAND